MNLVLKTKYREVNTHIQDTRYSQDLTTSKIEMQEKYIADAKSNRESLLTEKNNLIANNEEEIFTTTYYEFPGNFTANLKGSKKFLQVSVGVSTQYDEQVMVNVESHQLALRSEILTIMSEFSSEDISGKEGKYNLADALKNGINEVLMKVEGFGGIENVHFTSFVVQ